MPSVIRGNDSEKAYGTLEIAGVEHQDYAEAVDEDNDQEGKFTSPDRAGVILVFCVHLCMSPVSRCFCEVQNGYYCSAGVGNVQEGANVRKNVVQHDFNVRKNVE